MFCNTNGLDYIDSHESAVVVAVMWEWSKKEETCSDIEVLTTDQDYLIHKTLFASNNRGWPPHSGVVSDLLLSILFVLVSRPLFNHLLSLIGLSEHKRTVELCLSRIIRFHTLLVSHFQTLLRNINKRWTTTSGKWTNNFNFLMGTLERNQQIKSGYSLKRKYSHTCQSFTQTKPGSQTFKRGLY
jgi:hypothetical protein